jgi:hypothetical protein
MPVTIRHLEDAELADFIAEHREAVTTTPGCAGCRYWTPHQPPYVVRHAQPKWEDFEEGGIIYRGHCRRYPPAYVRRELPSQSFPFVDFDNWCGEFVRTTKPTLYD